MKPLPDQDTPPPTDCPFCHSSAITTASAKTNAEAYWRCSACGQMWNVGRLRPVSRQSPGGRWA